MADTTKANVLLVAPNLSGVSDSVFTQVIADAVAEFTDTTHGNYEEIVQRYYVAHVITMMIYRKDMLGVGTVEREKVGDIELEYSKIAMAGSDYFRSTPQGQEFLRLDRKYRQLVAY